MNKLKKSGWSFRDCTGRSLREDANLCLWFGMLLLVLYICELMVRDYQNYPRAWSLVESIWSAADGPLSLSLSFCGYRRRPCPYDIHSENFTGKPCMLSATYLASVSSIVSMRHNMRFTTTQVV